MTPDLWEVVKSVFDRAVALPQERREEFLQRECADETVRREVQSLIAAHDANPLLGEVPAATIIDPEPALPHRLGTYELTERIGSGGMGDVYLATDTRLGRKVAIKLLSPAVASNPDRIRRLTLEARAASALNHPNIVTVHELGQVDSTHYIVQEYVDGSTLWQVIHFQRPPLARLIALMNQVAQGLAKAHAAGIVHRDLKPQNILVTVDGFAKIIDFGLAKLYEPISGGDQAGTDVRTQEGVILGTIGYMAPEQAEGRPADARSDVFAFGCILYEAVTRQRAFAGDSAMSTLNKILYEQPRRVSEINRSVPPDVERIIRRCLAKDPEGRYQSMKDVVLELNDIQSDLSLPATRSRSARKALPWVGAAAMVAVIAGFVATRQPEPPPSPAEHRQVTFVGNAASPDLSPDGKSVAYLAGDAVFVQDLSGGDPLPVFRIPSARAPANVIRWSPDSSRLLVCIGTTEGIVTAIVPRLGGTPRLLKGAMMASWSPDGSEILSHQPNWRKLVILNLATGVTREVPVSGQFDFITRSSDWSSNGLITFVTVHSTPALRLELWTIRADGTGQQRVFESLREMDGARFSADGRSIFVLQTDTGGGTRSLIEVPIDERGRAISPPRRVLTGLSTAWQFGLSADRKRVVYTRENRDARLWKASLDPGGAAMSVEQLTQGTLEVTDPAYSPDGSEIAFIGTAQDANVYIMPAAGGPVRQVTFLKGTMSADLAWSPDGNRLAFVHMTSDSRVNLWLVDKSGANLREIPNSGVGIDGVEVDWAPAKELVYRLPGNRNLQFMDPDTGRTRRFLDDETRGWIFSPKYSRDGRQLAFYWNRNGGRIWVGSPQSGPERALGGGPDIMPSGWSSDNRSIYAVSTEKRVIKIDVRDGAVTRLPSIAPLEGIRMDEGQSIADLAVHPDDRTFLLAIPQFRSDVWIAEEADGNR